MKRRFMVESGLVVLVLTLFELGQVRAQCIPDCAGKQCGDDGCGGECGECMEGQTCVVDQCVWGCGNIGFEGCCYNHHMVSCDPIAGVIDIVVDCLQEGKECGWKSYSDGWGHYVCVPPPGLPDPSGNDPMECDFSCTPKCDGMECGDDRCGGSCGECAEGQVCFLGSCCTRDCEGKDCGHDGCGGECGDCGEGFWCADFFRCAYGYGCEQTSFPGCKGCACLGCVCEMDSWCCSVEWDWKCTYECQFDCGGCLPCDPQCEGKNCGDDGCGGTCGTCPDGQTCQEGSCASLPAEETHPAEDLFSTEEHAGEDQAEVQETSEEPFPNHGGKGVEPIGPDDIIPNEDASDPASDAGGGLDSIRAEEIPSNDTPSDQLTPDSTMLDKERGGGGGCRQTRLVPANGPAGVLFLVVLVGGAFRSTRVGRVR